MYWRMIGGILIGICVIGISPCLAPTLYWQGHSTSWNDPNNWNEYDERRVPTENDHVSIQVGPTYYPSLTFGEYYCKNIHIYAGASLTWGENHTGRLNVSGCWRNLGTLNPGGGTVRLFRDYYCEVLPDTFNRLEIHKHDAGNPATATLRDDIGVLEDISFSYGVLITDGYDLIGIGESNGLFLNNGQLLWDRETFTTSFETVNFGTGSVYFSGDSVQIIPSIYDYYNLYIGGSATKYPDGDLTVAHDLRVTSTFHANGHTVDIGNDCLIYGTYLMTDSETLMFNGGRLQLYENGLFSALGTNLTTGPTITRNPVSTQYYTFKVEGNSAVIAASYATFEYMDSNGVEIAEFALIDTVYPLDHCCFQNGDTVSPSAALLRIDNNQEITIPYANFPVMGAANVRKEVDYGRVTFMEATGIFAGDAYEVDFYDRIDWIGYSGPIPPIVVIEHDSVSATLIWNTVREDINGFPIEVESYIIYSSTDPTGPFPTVEDTVSAPDTTWIETGIIPTQSKKFYQVTAFDH